MQQQQGPGIRALAPLVHEVDPLPVDLIGVLVEAIQFRLDCAPVESVAPVLAQLAQVRHVGARLPATAGDLVREARPRQAFAQVGERALRNLDAEALHRADQYATSSLRWSQLAIASGWTITAVRLRAIILET